MTRPERVLDYLGHISEAIDRVTIYVRDCHDLTTFHQDIRTQDAVLRNIAIIGEAVAKIQKAAPEFIAAHPEVPWANIRGMRHVIVHDYFHVDIEIVWRTVIDDMPRMRQDVERLLAEHRLASNERLPDRPASEP